MPEQRPARLLLNLKVTVETLLESNVPDVWHVYGGLNRLFTALTDILYHGFKLCDTKGEPDLWIFIQGLNWLQPSLGGCISPGQEASHVPDEVRNNKAKQWIYCNLESLSITEKLSWLLSDREHLINCYHEMAFLSNPKYAEALLVCLKAVEENKLSLLTEVDPSLYVISATTPISRKTHRRCSSFPQSQPSWDKNQEIEMPVFRGQETAVDRARVVTGIGIINGNIPQLPEWVHARAEISAKLKKTQSLPNLINEPVQEPMRMRSKTIVSKISPSVLAVDYSEPSRSQRPPKPKRVKERPQRTFMDDGGYSIQPAATGYFRRPTEGQSLTSYLSSGSFTTAELDRENAHFRISEAMISVIEQVKSKRTLRQAGGSSSGSAGDGRDRPEERNSRPSASTSGNSDLRHRRRRNKQTEERPIRRGCGSWGDRDTTASEQTPTPPSSSEDEFSEEAAGSDAEQVALSLLKQFEEQQLPRASDLEWLVAPGDTPQELLPMPGCWPVRTVQGLCTPLRGTADWAPPRPQLILTVHPSPVKKVLLVNQKFRCAGCGSRVAPEYANRFRYCEYLGKLFCTGCHTNQSAVIPARVIHHWDFNRYPVSAFSYQLLCKMFTDPLFRIDDLNPRLYKKVKALEKSRDYRLQLHFLKDFLLSCRFANHLKELIEAQPSYTLNEPDCFSLCDLLSVRSGEVLVGLQALVNTGLAHVATCDLCQARGFLCELCSCKAVIFPWFIREVSRCPRCGACFHRKCFKPQTCPRCERLAARRLLKVT